jgi:hypothetical protein
MAMLVDWQYLGNAAPDGSATYDGQVRTHCSEASDRSCRSSTPSLLANSNPYRRLCCDDATTHVSNAFDRGADYYAFAVQFGVPWGHCRQYYDATYQNQVLTWFLLCDMRFSRATNS